MKINIGSNKERREVEIGNKGDFILVLARNSPNYSLGKLERVTTLNFVQQIEFEGSSYVLTTEEVFGAEFHGFRKRSESMNYRRKCRYFDSKMIMEVVSGIEEIIDYLGHHPEKRYRGQADLIRKIAKAQKEKR